jgi:imidazole glycerol-phosphate synthase subunit HisH
MTSNLFLAQRVVVVDYGSGNLRSVAQALQAVSNRQTTISISNDPTVIANANRLVLPGQGAMPDCMQHLTQSGLLEAVLQAAQTKPLMGICVGQQMLLDGSAEAHEGSKLTLALGLIAGEVVRFPTDLKDAAGNRLKVPHMGWNQVVHTPIDDLNKPPHPIFKGIANGERFYFVHSYYAKPKSPEHNLATTDYGVLACVAVGRDNLIGLQFHPEKSAAAGLALYKNFLDWTV